MIRDLDHVIFTEEEISARVKELGAELTKEYEGKFPLFVGVLKGSFVFMADIVRAVNINCEVDFMGTSSYSNGTSSTGAVKITKDLTRDIEGRHIVIIEDILDSGISLSYLKKYLETRNPASIRICTLLNKISRRKAAIEADYVGFECPDDFVVGYGLDYAEKYRNLPYIGVLKPEIYS